MDDIVYDPGPPVIVLFVITWPIYALPSLILMPIVFWREKKLPWVLADIPVAVLPWFIWVFIFKSTEDADKKLLHAIVECFVIGCFVPAALSFILIFKGRTNPHLMRIAVLMAAGLLAMALCTYFFRLGE